MQLLPGVGIVSCIPAFKDVEASGFCALISSMLIPYILDMAYRVSPGFTVCVDLVACAYPGCTAKENSIISTVPMYFMLYVNIIINRFQRYKSTKNAEVYDINCNFAI